MNMDDEQPLMAPTEQQPLVGKQTTWSRRTLALGALFGASLLLGAAVSGSVAPSREVWRVWHRRWLVCNYLVLWGAVSLRLWFMLLTTSIVRWPGPVSAALGGYPYAYHTVLVTVYVLALLREVMLMAAFLRRDMRKQRAKANRSLRRWLSAQMRQFGSCSKITAPSQTSASHPGAEP